MQLGRVIGTVVATQKVEGLAGVKLLLVQPLHASADGVLHKSGDPQAAADVVQAGPGDLVHLVGSREAALALDPSFVPVDLAIVGIVDAVDRGVGASAVPSVFAGAQRSGAPSIDKEASR